MIKKKRKDKGFTLVELVVVIAILAVLAALIVPRILGNVKDAQDKTEIANARTLASEITVYNATHDTDITNDTGGFVTSAKFTTGTGLTLPTGIAWPDTTVVKIEVDTKGNAEIVLVGTSPAPTGP